MKFGKTLESKQLELPEYLGHFINYRGLKKVIKQLATIDSSDSKIIDYNDQQIEKLLQDNKSTFFFRVERELDNINDFYLEKQADLKLKLDILVNKKNQLFASGSSDVKDGRTQNSSITFQTLYANLKQFTKQIDQLSQFVELNETGFRKILKKWDKRSKSHLKEIFLLTTVNVQPVFHREEINQLNDLIANSLLELEAYADGENVIVTEIVPDQQISVKQVVNDDKQTDELYSKFFNIATAPNNQLILLSNWLSKLKDFQDSEKLTRVFFLAIAAFIEDVYLINFYSFFKNYIDLSYVDIYTNRSFLHQIALTNSIKFQARQKKYSKTNILGLQTIDETKQLAEEPLDCFSRYFLAKILIVDEKENSNFLTLKDNNSKTALHYAAEFGKTDLLKLLVDRAPESLAVFDNHTMTPLLLAIKFHHLSCVTYLLSKESSRGSTQISDGGYLPLNFACKYGKYDIIKVLLEYDSIIDRNTQNVEGLLPLHIVASSGHYKVVELLVNFGKLDPNCLSPIRNWTPIFCAAYHGHSRTTRELIKYGALPDIVDNKNYTPLFYAAYYGHVNVLNILFHSIDLTNPNTPLTISNLKQQNFINNGVVSPGNSLFKALPSKKPTGTFDETSGPGQHIVSNSVSLPSTESYLLASTTEHLSEKIKLDAIPTLSLPPPIIPLRKYGHNFLEKKTSLQIFFYPGKLSIRLFHSNKRQQTAISDSEEFPDDEYDSPLYPGRITISSNTSDIIPRNLLLPIDEKENFVNFQITELTDGFSIDFELFPTFGTKLIAKTTALSNVFLKNKSYMSDDCGTVTLPLFDTRLKNIGDLTFKYQVVYSYCGTPLEISKYETYWKSTNANDQEIGEDSKFTSMLSFVAASSLLGDYLKINIYLLKDGTPIICPRNYITIENGINISLLNLDSKELFSLVSKNYQLEDIKETLSSLGKEYSESSVESSRKKFLRKINDLMCDLYLPLDLILEYLPVKVSINFEIFYPTNYELKHCFTILSMKSLLFEDVNINSFVDRILTILFNHIRLQTVAKRSIVFSSFNPVVCKILNWKQPNFPVFFSMGGFSFNYTTNSFEATSANGYCVRATIENTRKPSVSSEAANHETEEDNWDEKVTSKVERDDTCTRSVEEAIRFASVNNLIGLILPLKLLTLIPDLSESIRSRGLILVGNKSDNRQFCGQIFEQLPDQLPADPALTANPITDFGDIEIADYSKANVNAVQANNILEFQGSIDM